MYMCSAHGEVAWQCWQRSNRYYSLYCDFIDVVIEWWMLFQWEELFFMCQRQVFCLWMILSVCDMFSWKISPSQSETPELIFMETVVFTGSYLNTGLIFIFCLHWTQFLACIVPHQNVSFSQWTICVEVAVKFSLGAVLFWSCVFSQGLFLLLTYVPLTVVLTATWKMA